MSIYCEGKNCSKKDTCLKHFKVYGFNYEDKDLSTTKKGCYLYQMFNTRFECGDYADNYAYYINFETDLDIINEVLYLWKKETNITRQALSMYNPDTGVLTIFTPNSEQMQGYHDKYLKKYTDILISKIKGFNVIKFTDTEKLFKIEYSIGDKFLNVDDVAYVNAIDEDKARDKLKDYIKQLNSDLKFYVINIDEIKTDVYTNRYGDKRWD